MWRIYDFFKCAFLGKSIEIIRLNINIVLSTNKRVQQNVTRCDSVENNNGFYMGTFMGIFVCVFFSSREFLLNLKLLNIKRLILCVAECVNIMVWHEFNLESSSFSLQVVSFMLTAYTVHAHFICHISISLVFFIVFYLYFFCKSIKYHPSWDQIYKPLLQYNR